jgi:uncharacterized membrane protein YfcA
MAIVGAAIGSWLLFDFVPNSLFLLGTALVVLSVYLYTAYPFRSSVDVVNPNQGLLPEDRKSKMIQK